MTNRTSRMLSIVGISITLLITAYSLLLYSAALKADHAQDLRTAALLQGEAKSHQKEMWAALERLAVSDAVFDAAASGDQAVLSKTLCDATRSTGFVSIGIMTLSGEALALCEDGALKITAEHGYVFEAASGLVRTTDEFRSALEAQTSFGRIFPEYAFADRYLTLAERPYLMVAALSAPRSARVLGPEYRPVVIFGLSGLRLALASLADRLAVTDLEVSGADAAPRGANVLLEDRAHLSRIVLAWQPSDIFRGQLLRALPVVLGLTLLVLLGIAHHLRRVAGFQADLVRREAEMRHMALHDNLTGLPNRTHFLRVARQALKGASPSTPVYVGIFDLDRFKMVNDTFGHDVGDELIIAAGERARAALGPSNFIARLGGDEFALVISGVDGDAAAIEVLKDVGAAIARPVETRQFRLDPTASIGAARADSPEVDLDNMMKMADLALYEVKSNGRAHCRLFKERRIAGVRSEAKA